MDTIQRKRFIKLIDFLDTLKPEKFNFRRIIDGMTVKRQKRCGTVCCAMGWTPKLFPKLVKWTCDYAPAAASEGIQWTGEGLQDDSDFTSVAKLLFGISKSEAKGLFIPYTQDEIGLDSMTLSNVATPKQVANLMREFLRIYYTE